METLTTYWTREPEIVLAQLNGSLKGLTTSEATHRQLALNHQKKTRPLWLDDIILLLSQFKSPLVLLLIAAVILSAFLGETSDVIIIVSILLLTGLLSFWQERNANHAVQQLQRMVKVQTKVWRDGKITALDANQVVAGDLLDLSAGDIIPADCLLVSCQDLHTNEATLTGETYPMEKSPGAVAENTPLAKRHNCLFQGTSIVSGTAQALVVHTGSDTVFGQIASEIQTATGETAFEVGIRRFGFLLMQITLVLSIVIVVVNLYFGRPFMESILFALAITVGMAPELLPAIMTVAMSSGARRLATQNVIVKKLSSIQNLGEVDLLCSDKTGTLTEGVIKVARITDVDGKDSPFVQQLAFLNAFFESGYSNPVDEAIRALIDTDVQGWEKKNEIPYDFIRKRLSVLVTKEGQAQIVTKGAVKNILETCNQVISNGNLLPLETYRNALYALYEEFSRQGFRTIGIAYKPFSSTSPVSKSDEKEMIFAGFVLLYDPPKEGVIKVIEQLQKMNVKLKVITGDNQLVAAYVGRQVGLSDVNVITGAELQKMSPEALRHHVLKADIFAEIEPNQKEHIIHALRKARKVVAYMGDGINDVAALHAADVGISMNNAVGVAKEAADVVLLEKNLDVIAAGIIEGRKTFNNTLKYIFITTSATFGNMFSMAGASLLLPFLPMLPEQILMTNFLTDLPFLSIASDNVDAEQLAHPQRWNNALIRRFMLIFGLLSSVFDLFTFYVLYNILDLNATSFHSGWFVESTLTELLILFVIRTHKSFLKSRPGNILLLLGGSVIGLTIALPYIPFFAQELGLTPLPLPVLATMLGIVVAYIGVSELTKRFVFKRLRK